MSDYYARHSKSNTDGSRIFASEEDNSMQAEVAALIEVAFGPGLEVKQFGRLCPIDFYAERDGRMCALLEVKCRTHTSSQYPTVFLNVRKWLALTMGSLGFGVPSFFVVRFTDRVKFVNVADVDASNQRVGGTKRLVKSHSDREPVIEVPVGNMQELQSGR
jgi:hypothetical protein